MDLAEDKSFNNDNGDGERQITIKKLVIYQLNRSHANSTYTCQAGNDDNTIESNLRMTVLINMYCEYKSIKNCVFKYFKTSDNHQYLSFNYKLNSVHSLYYYIYICYG